MQRRWHRPTVVVVGVGLALLGAWIYHVTSRRGYTLVFAPEGVPGISVSYWALAGPAALWIAAALLDAGVVGPCRRPRARRVRPPGPTGRGQPRLDRRRHDATPTHGHRADADADRADHRVRGVDLGVQPDVPAASRRRREAHQRRRCDRSSRQPGRLCARMSAHGSRRCPASAMSSRSNIATRTSAPTCRTCSVFAPSTIVDATELQDSYFTGGTARELMGRSMRPPTACS